ncbi:hypothetical protein GJ496_003771 [Pomphorhynchus laevis]|nr:hypothetical protein GJ496_003771 [Pomphorhynchus laevis]
MERIIKAHAQRDTSTTGYMVTKKNLKIDPDHSIMKCLHAYDTGDKSMKDLVVLLFELSLLGSGFSLEHPESYSERINQMIELGPGIDVDVNELLNGMDGMGNAAAVSANESDATRMDDLN